MVHDATSQVAQLFWTEMVDGVKWPFTVVIDVINVLIAHYPDLGQRFTALLDHIITVVSEDAAAQLIHLKSIFDIYYDMTIRLLQLFSRAK